MISNKVFICIFCFFLIGILYTGAQMLFVLTGDLGNS